MRTTLRLEAVSRSGFDARLAQLGSGRLTRTAGVTYLESDRDVVYATCQLALAGIRCSMASLPNAQVSLRPAIALDLAPLEAALGAIDVVEVGRIPVGEATTVLLQRRLPWLPRSRVARDACLRLLREEDAVIGWRRVVWCSVNALRAVRSRIRVRPVVFDRAALGRQGLQWTYVTDRAIEDWAFA